MIYIFWTSRNKNEAKTIIHSLLESRLIACASLFPVESIYRWDGAVVEDTEVKVILKTRADLFENIKEIIQTKGSYEVPEVAQILPSACNPAYLAWLEQETSTPSRRLPD